MQYKITIPEPCRQNWDTMLPDDTGRYCNSCKKSVVDFTAKSDEEIQQFFINNFNQPFCGRFKNTQLHRIVIDLPKNILIIKMPLWMRFLVACLIIFGISIFPFETTIAGKNTSTTFLQQGESVKISSVKKLRIVKKKKSRKHRKNVFNPAIFLTTVGYTTTTNPPINISFLNTHTIINQETNNQLSSNTEELPHKEEPAPTPNTPTEFILPSALLIKKENSSETMD